MSQRTRIKICGVKAPEVAAAAVEAGADAIGLVFVHASPRCVTPAEASRTAAAVGAYVDVVGLFLGTSATEITHHAHNVPLTMVQLHGSGAGELLRAVAPLRAVCSQPFDESSAEDDLRKWTERRRSSANLSGLLIDRADTERAGGTGERFDWHALRRVLDRVAPDLPIILAGGLNPENVDEAVRVVRPFAVDVSSGVESQRGVKDIAKIRDFCRAVRETE